MASLSGLLLSIKHNSLSGCIGAFSVILLLLPFGVSMLGLGLVTVILTYFMSKISVHFGLVVEHLYMGALSPVCRWCHIKLLKLGLWLSGSTFHADFIDRRTSLAPDLHVHLIPVLSDNYCYLIVHTTASAATGVLIDVGDAEPVGLALKYLNERFEYSPHGIQIEAILSTHKHHDHTAGNLTFKKNYPHCIPSSSQLEIVGSAVEGVPGCTRAVRHGDEVAYSAGRIRLKVVAVPCHTRGSVCFVLADASASSACCVFTGDALFCGGCGAPFEAGLNKHSAMHVQMTFAEILVATSPPNRSLIETLIFPGHEYTSVLLGSQTLSGETAASMGPSAFFECMSLLFTMDHKDNRLGTRGGREPTVPGTLKREMSISSEYRRMKWHAAVLCSYLGRVAEAPVEAGDIELDLGDVESAGAAEPEGTGEGVFEVLFRRDLDLLVRKLASVENISGPVAASALMQLREKGVRQEKIERERLEKRVAMAGNTPSKPNKERTNLVEALVALGCSPPALCNADAAALGVRTPSSHARGWGEDDRVDVGRLLLVLGKMKRKQAAKAGATLASLVEAIEGAGAEGVTAGRLATEVLGAKKPEKNALLAALTCGTCCTPSPPPTEEEGQQGDSGAVAVLDHQQEGRQPGEGLMEALLRQAKARDEAMCKICDGIDCNK